MYEQILKTLSRYKFTITRVEIDSKYEMYDVERDIDCTIDVDNIKELLKAKFGSKISFQNTKTNSFNIRVNKL